MKKLFLSIILISWLFPYTADAKLVNGMSAKKWAELINSCNSEIKDLEGQAENLFDMSSRFSNKIEEIGDNLKEEAAKNKKIKKGEKLGQPVKTYVKAYKNYRRDLTKAINAYQKCIKNIKLTKVVTYKKK